MEYSEEVCKVSLSDEFGLSMVIVADSKRTTQSGSTVTAGTALATICSTAMTEGSLLKERTTIRSEKRYFEMLNFAGVLPDCIDDWKFVVRLELHGHSTFGAAIVW